MKDLPYHPDLNIGALTGIFHRTTTSYKYLFFLAFLELCKKNHFELSEIPFDKLTLEMLTIAWYPHIYFKLSFGVQDKIADYLDSLVKDLPEQTYLDLTNRRKVKKFLKNHAFNGGLQSLQRYVPYRLLRVFFAAEVKGTKDHKVNDKISQLTRDKFDTNRPLYKINATEDKITPHPTWLAYLHQNHSIVEGW